MYNNNQPSSREESNTDAFQCIKRYIQRTITRWGKNIDKEYSYTDLQYNRKSNCYGKDIIESLVTYLAKFTHLLTYDSIIYSFYDDCVLKVFCYSIEWLLNEYYPDFLSLDPIQDDPSLFDFNQFAINNNLDNRIVDKIYKTIKLFLYTHHLQEKLFKEHHYNDFYIQVLNKLWIDHIYPLLYDSPVGAFYNSFVSGEFDLSDLLEKYELYQDMEINSEDKFFVHLLLSMEKFSVGEYTRDEAMKKIPSYNDISDDEGRVDDTYITLSSKETNFNSSDHMLVTLLHEYYTKHYNVIRGIEDDVLIKNVMDGKL